MLVRLCSAEGQRSEHLDHHFDLFSGLAEENVCKFPYFSRVVSQTNEFSTEIFDIKFGTGYTQELSERAASRLVLSQRNKDLNAGKFVSSDEPDEGEGFEEVSQVVEGHRCCEETRIDHPNSTDENDVQLKIDSEL